MMKAIIHFYCIHKIRTFKVKRLLGVACLTVLIMIIFSYLYVEPLYQQPDSNGFGQASIMYIETLLEDSPTTTVQSESKPAKNVFFLKLHKCASSTVQNILMRYGIKHDLNFVLPYSENYLGHPAPFDASMAIPLSGNADTFNIFCHHTRFSKTGVAQVMPNDTTIYLAIVRNPVDLFESMFSYYELSAAYQMPLEQFVSMPSWWLAAVHRHRGRIGLNQMAFDFGMSESSFAYVDRVDDFIRFLDSRFHLVMVAEHFDESLILLKKLLDLNYEDIVYFKQNERFRVERHNLSENVRHKIREANRIDQLIYEHFVKVFHQRVRKFGKQRMADELAQYRHWKSYWYATCGTSSTSRDESLALFRPYSTKVKAFHVKENPHRKFCETLAIAEIPFTEQLRSKHLVRHGTRWQQFLNYIGLFAR